MKIEKGMERMRSTLSMKAFCIIIDYQTPRHHVTQMLQIESRSSYYQVYEMGQCSKL